MDRQPSIFKNIEKQFLNNFELEWEKSMQSMNLLHKQFSIGSRLRPQIALWGYLSTLQLGKKPNLDNIAKTSVSIEMIHKASLLIDDWIDGDIARRGEKTVHVEYGAEYAVVVAILMVAESMRRLKESLPQNLISPTTYYTCVDTIVQTVHAMSLGLLEELQLTRETILDLDKVKNVARLETAEILANGMLLGYYSGGGNNKDVIIIFKQIGDQCGYLFQTMNDLEAFSSNKKNIIHKGAINYDIDEERKNIAIAKLYLIASKKEKKIIKNGNGKEISELMTKYNISEIILKEMMLVYKNILNNVNNLKQYGVSREWTHGFSNFMKKLKKYAEERLSK